MFSGVDQSIPNDIPTNPKIYSPAKVYRPPRWRGGRLRRGQWRCRRRGGPKAGSAASGCPRVQWQKPGEWSTKTWEIAVEIMDFHGFEWDFSIFFMNVIKCDLKIFWWDLYNDYILPFGNQTCQWEITWNPLSMEVYSLKIIEQDGGFSSKPRLVTGG
jgi:hypothetical protein